MRPPVISRHDPRCIAAYHEAGHAVVAEIVGLPSRGVSIVKFAASDGRHTLAVPFGHLAPWRLATWMHAGPEAEKKFIDRPDARGGSYDYFLARELLELTREPTGPSTEALMDRYATLAAAHTIVYWRWIDKVAVELLTRRIPVLSAEDVRALRPERTIR